MSDTWFSKVFTNTPLETCCCCPVYCFIFAILGAEKIKEIIKTGIVPISWQ